MNATIKKTIELSGSHLVLRDEEATIEHEALLRTRMPALPTAVVEFFSRVSGGKILVAEAGEDADCASFIVDASAPTLSVDDELSSLGIGLGDDLWASYFRRCFPLFRYSHDYYCAWCLDLNPGEGFGQIFTCQIFYGEHPIESAAIWARSFEEWLEMVVEDNLVLLKSPQEVSQRRISRLPYPVLRLPDQ